MSAVDVCVCVCIREAILVGTFFWEKYLVYLGTFCRTPLSEMLF